MYRDAKHNLEAIALVCCAYAGFSIADAMAKYLMGFYPVHMILVISSFFAVLITAIWIITKQGLSGLISPNWRIHMMRGLSACVLIQCALRAYDILPLAEFYGIIFTSPLLVLVFSRFLLHEYVSPQALIAVLVGFAGMLVITGPVYSVMSTGIFYALGAMICISLNILFMRKLNQRDILPIYPFYPNIFIFVSNLPFALYDFQIPASYHGQLFVPYIAILITAQICSGLGYRHARATAAVAPFHYTQMVWGIILGFLVFGDMPLVTTLIGAAMIIGAGLYTIWQQSRQARAGRAVPVRS